MLKDEKGEGDEAKTEKLRAGAWVEDPISTGWAVA